MLKKLFAFGVVLFLAACGEGISGATITTCTDASLSSSSVTSVSVGTVIIDGYDEEIRLWTERIEQNRHQYVASHWDGEDPGDDVIEDWFAAVGEADAELGIVWTLVSLDEDTIIHEVIYDYSLIPEAELNEAWNVDDFDDEVTLTTAIIGLESRDATICITN